MRNSAWFPRLKKPTQTVVKARERAKRARDIDRQAAEIAARYGNDPARIERHARLLDALDPGCAEALRDIRLPGRRRA